MKYPNNLLAKYFVSLLASSVRTAAGAGILIAITAALVTPPLAAGPPSSPEHMRSINSATPLQLAQNGQDSIALAPEFINDLAQTSITALNDQTNSPALLRQFFSDLFDQKFATQEISRIVLGRAWNKADEGERDQFRAILGGFLAKQLIEGFPPNGRIEVVSARQVDAVERTDTLIEVRSLFSSADVQGEVLWSVVTTDGKLRILDATFAGRSFLLTQRAEFAEILRQVGGSIPALIDEIAG